MKTPIVLVAFGSTRASSYYEKMVDEMRESFPGHELLLALSSRMVRRSQKKAGDEAVGPVTLLGKLWDKGYSWAVVQSLHVTAGHEFYRMVEECNSIKEIRAGIGLPLLWGPEDYQGVAHSLGSFFKDVDDTATVFIGHGTDHAAWSAYPALENFLRVKYGPAVWVGVVDGRPGPEEVAKEVRRTGCSRARLVPLMMVPGVHFMEDIAGNGPDSWAHILEERGIKTECLETGLLDIEGVRTILVRHAREALEVTEALTPKRSRRDQTDLGNL